jgi:hypothetical protein
MLAILKEIAVVCSFPVDWCKSLFTHLNNVAVILALFEF